MIQNYSDLSEKFADACVLIVGDVMLDRYWWGNVTRISPEAPVPVVRLKSSSLAPGGAANVAVNVASLGASPILLGYIGADADGECLAAELAAKGVSPDNLLLRAGAPTNVKTRIIAHNQQVVRVDQEFTSELTNEEEDTIFQRFGRFINDADVIVCSDYAKGVLTSTLVRRIIDEARRLGKTVLVDPKGRDYSRYRGSQILTPNRREAAEACGLDEDTPGVVETTGERLLNDLELEALLITQSEDGMTLFAVGAEPVRLPAHAIEIYDVTGAGDTVIAAMSTALASGLPYEDAAHIANVAAGIVVEQVGTSAVTIEKLITILNRTADSSL